MPCVAASIGGAHGTAPRRHPRRVVLRRTTIGIAFAESRIDREIRVRGTASNDDARQQRRAHTCVFRNALIAMSF
jgi:hypothetical protein